MTDREKRIAKTCAEILRMANVIVTRNARRERARNIMRCVTRGR